MATHTQHGRAMGPAGTSSSVVGGLVSLVLALIQLYFVSVGGLAGTLLLFVVWPLVGGIIAAAGIGGLVREQPLAGALAGTYGALVTSLVVLLTGAAGLWSSYITTTFGVSLWPVFFATTLLTVISWTVFGYVAGYLVGRSS